MESDEEELHKVARDHNMIDKKIGRSTDLYREKSINWI